MEAVGNALPVGTECVARDAQSRRPGNAAERGEQAEPAGRHAGEPRRQRDEGAHHGNEPADQHRGRPVPLEPRGGAVDLPLADPDPAPPEARSCQACVLADRPGDVAACDVAEDAGDDDPEERRVRTRHGARGQRAAEQHDDLGRNRDAGRLGQHQQEHRQVPVLGDEVLHRQFLLSDAM
jgi:hypothetical protein